VSTRIILRSDIDKLGKRGDIVEVSDGHFRNYLAPRGLAIKATDGAVSQAGAMRRARDLRDATDREGAQAIASALVAKTITIQVKAGSEGRLYGSVNAADVAQAIEEQTGIVVDRKQLTVPQIKATGEHSVTAKLHSAVEFPITLEVTGR
jgi:large subunit ribosomal protein L9